MQKESISDEASRARKRLDHCNLVIARQTRFVEDMRLAGNHNAEQVALDAISIALRVRLRRKMEFERLKDLSLAS